MQNAAFEHAGVDFCYVTFSIAPENLKDAVMGARALGFAGLNVTVPHKEAIIPYLDEIDKAASFIGAVNTVVNKNGKLVGYNTDGLGFMQSLKDEGIKARGKNILIVGAGGAARGICHYLAKECDRLFVYNRTPDKAVRLVRDLSAHFQNAIVLEEILNLDDVDMVINCTTLGLDGRDAFPFDVALLNRHHVLCDLIYRPTRLQAEAAQRGAKVFTGMGMLLHQGALAFKLWTKVAAPVSVMRDVLVRSIQG